MNVCSGHPFRPHSATTVARFGADQICPDVVNKMDSKLVTYLCCHVPERRPEEYDRKEETY